VRKKREPLALRPFTHDPRCNKCGSAVRIAYRAGSKTSLFDCEHILLNCDACGFADAMMCAGTNETGQPTMS